MKLLVIGYVWPEPKSSAAGSRMMQLLEVFRGQGWQVHFASPAQMTEHMADLSRIEIACHSIELNSASFDRFIQHLAPDIVVFDRFMMEEQFGWRVEKCLPSALRVLNTEDLHSLRDGRHQAVKEGREFELRDMHTPMAWREIAAIFRSDLTLMISDVEMTLLQNQFHVPATQLHYIPLMVEAQSSCHLPSFDERQHFITIGNFRHAPNWDAVLQLKQHLWPSIRKKLPKAELHIYGAYPPPKATQLHNPKDGFCVKGWVDDALQVMCQARILLAPLRFGAGIKGKLIDAMTVRTPSVTTPVGAEGISDDWPGAIAYDDQDFIEKAVALYQDSARWHQAQERGDALLASRFLASLHASALIEKLVMHHSQLNGLRGQHFMSSMLRHHSMKSTQYMSQWIEAKNQLSLKVDSPSTE
ncbi:glycosyltransferase [Nitrincola nitratireducens]|uniref:Sugar transferase, PEP-CTERM/EpsH1 system associated n=1 Tax=Nitrincola nitratireducens TaxID=1229521 RepID=W9UT62_9GAMM|nr:glycosyltransferase family 4 protein [Nitrincola nitratireducens]EXJ10289.1 hypothetical protein D791_02848 [Nitrincola nitratireducens]